MEMVHHNFLFTTSAFTSFTMAGVTGSKTFGLSVLVLSMLFLLAAHVHAHEDHAAVEAKDSVPESSQEEHVKYGRITFSEDHEGSDSEHPTCTCTCYPGAAPKTPTGAPKPPTSQNSPTGRKRSPPPAPYYSPIPVYNSPSPPPGSTQSPVTFDHSPPPPAPYSDAPTDEPSPVVAAPETFQPPPPIY